MSLEMQYKFMDKVAQLKFKKIITAFIYKAENRGGRKALFVFEKMQSYCSRFVGTLVVKEGTECLYTVVNSTLICLYVFPLPIVIIIIFTSFFAGRVSQRSRE